MSRLFYPFIATAAALGMAVALPGAASAASSSAGAMKPATNATQPAQSGKAAATETTKPEASKSMSKTSEATKPAASEKMGKTAEMAKPATHAKMSKTGMHHRATVWNKRVRAAQTALNKQDHAGLMVDGILGHKTRAAIKKFQAKNGLKATGKLDKATLGKLNVPA